MIANWLWLVLFVMFRYDIQCDNTYSEHTRFVCSLRSEAGEDQFTHNLICFTILGVGVLLMCSCWIKTSCGPHKNTKEGKK